MNNAKQVKMKATIIDDELEYNDNQETNSQKITFLDRLIIKLSHAFAAISGFSLVAMMSLVVFNAVKRTVASPFSGTTEVVGWLAAITFSFGLAFTQLHRGHVDIDLLVKKLPTRMEKWLRVVFILISVLFFSIVAWQLVSYGMTIMNNKNVSQTLQVIFYPFIYLTAVGFFMFVAVLVKDLFSECRRKVN